VCDFGLSKVVKTADAQMTADTLGSPQYAAPELNSETHTNKVDIFSFAIMYALCSILP
jgi:serine/threonine protein kinase